MDRTQLLIGVAVALFSLGLVGVIVRRHVLVMLMCMELMLNGVNLSLVTFAQQTGAASRVVAQRLSVRETEKLVQHLAHPSRRGGRRTAGPPDPDLARLEETLAASTKSSTTRPAAPGSRRRE